ncbi:twin-arginine translocase TatA/TatE family subunit [Kribbella sp. NPDC026596]|uniref:twin-arginine translocase TatA/TatE family subunit n=1 Tax=Kribbella sp. NPDC026596 TaxID=3155122 RepID=UPI0033D18A4B
MVPQLELPQGGEWVVILIIVVLLFGAKKLPELTKNAARAMNEFNKARSGDDEKPEVEATGTGSAGRADLEGGGSESVGEDRRGL